MSLINTRYGKLEVIESDSIVSESLRIYGEWGQLELNLLEKFIKKSSVVLDIGCFIGSHSRAFSNMVGSSGKVIAFEARKAISDIASRNSKLGLYDNITIINSALGKNKAIFDVAGIDLTSDENFGGMQIKASDQTHDIESINITTLDSHKIERVDFIKIDVEGMESEVLLGAAETLSKHKPIIFTECNSVADGSTVMCWAIENGYKTYGHISLAFNQKNFNLEEANIFGNAVEVGFILIPENQVHLHENVIAENSLLNIADFDSLVLLMLHKPQYPYEILSQTSVGKILSLSYMSPNDAVNKDLLDKRNEEVAQLNEEVAQLNEEVIKLRNEALNHELTLNDYINSKSWKITAPLRFANTFLRRCRKVIVSFKEYILNIFLKDRSFPVYHKYKIKDFLGGGNSEGKEIKSSISVDILIPVYNGFEYIDPLIQSILRGTDMPYRLIIIDDCSSDTNVLPLLRKYAENHQNILLIENSQNLGFIKSVNLGVKHVQSEVFVLLNSDTEVPNGWISRLVKPLFNDLSIASANPMSNSATICSFPNPNKDNEIYLGLDADIIDSAFSSESLFTPPIRLPTTIGFCMAINKKAVQEIGMFDTAFGLGYCEENDWCMRAEKAGYKHILVNNLFVYHKHGGSFTSEVKKKQLEKNYGLLISRYPHYGQLIEHFINADPIDMVRKINKLKLLSRQSESVVVILDHNLGGGANSYSKELIDDLLAEKKLVIVFVDSIIEKRTFVKVFSALDVDAPYLIELSSIDDLSDLFKLIQVSEVIYNNLVGSSQPLAIVNRLKEMQEIFRFDLITLIHDFYPICPSFNLLDYKGKYCGIPEISECEKCVSKITPDICPLIPIEADIKKWRDTWLGLLNCSESVVCFSENSREILALAYPEVLDKVTVRPHTIASFDQGNKKSKPLHIGIIGGINYAKGLNVVVDLAKLVVKNDLDVKLTVIGQIGHQAPIQGLTVTGRYDRNQLPNIIKDLDVDVFLFPSVWPETFSYVTSELIQLDQPVICFDLGAPADRVRLYKKGLVLPIETTTPVLLESIYDFYKSINSIK